ncbi:hypothetical protein [Thermococcus sp.]|uniref:hypothetical protein n=1 Tax=Thermococcus sp. TaxID=35749 RepID=UPI002629B9F9|nr:hypothetical protein [Thermococcus sp.]
MNRRVLALTLVALIILAPIAYVAYAYKNFDSVLNPGKPKGTSNYVVIYHDGQFYVLTSENYASALAGGKKLPPGSKVFNVTLKSYITGSPEVDLNLTLRSFYNRFTIVIGSPSVQECKTNPEAYPGNCQMRTAVAAEVSALTSAIFSANYYIKAKDMGYDNASARQYAYQQTQMRHQIAYLSFITKLSIGMGSLGNEKNLAVLLIGPAEGAKCNCVFAPRKGLLVIEGTSDATLRAEVVLIENIIGFKWPQGNNTKTVQITG